MVCAPLSATVICSSSSRNRNEDCVGILAEWTNLRCRALLSAGGEKDPARANAVADRNPTAWETNVVLNSLAVPMVAGSADVAAAARNTQSPTTEDVHSARLRLTALRDSIATRFRSDNDGGSVEEGEHVWDRGGCRWDGFEKTPPWWVF